MGGGPSQSTNQVQSTNQNFNDLSNMVQNMSSTGTTNTNSQSEMASLIQQAQNTFGTNQSATTGGNTGATTGSSTGAQTGTSAGTVNPWAPAMPDLSNLLSAIGGQMGPNGQGTAVTPAQQAALQAAMASSGAIPNFGPAASGAVANMFSNPNGIPQAGMWQNAYNNYQGAMKPFTDFNNINPYQTPGVQEWLNGQGGLNDNIMTSLKNLYAGSGRDPTGAGNFGKSATQAMTAADAPILAGQYNQNVADYMGANANVFGGAGTTAQGTTGLFQTPLQNELAAMGQANNVPGIWLGPSSAQLGVANQAYSLPYGNINLPAGMVSNLAGLGQQTSGQTAGQQTGATAGTSTGTNFSDTTGSNTSQTTSQTLQQQQQAQQQQQQTQKQATGSSSGTQTGQAAGTSVGNSTTQASSNPFATAAGIGLGLFSMFG